MDEALFTEFIEVYERFHAIEQEYDAIRTLIVECMQQENITKLETVCGVFTVAKRVSWLYSAAVEKLQEKVKLRQVYEQKKSIAQKSKTAYLRYTVPIVKIL